MNVETTLAEAEAIIAAQDEPKQTDAIRTAARRLINIYEMCFNSDHDRKLGAKLVVELASRDRSVVDLLIESAKQYAKSQYKDDASPYSPNSFTVLARIGSDDERIITFLRHTVESDWGIPRWAAVDALCTIKDDEADRILLDILAGKYPPAALDLKSDICTIEAAKGRQFLDSGLSTA